MDYEQITNKMYKRIYVLETIENKKTLKRINLLLQDINKNNFTDIGKPEPLKNELSGY